MISAISFGNKTQYVNEATIFAAEKAEKIGKEIAEKVTEKVAQSDSFVSPFAVTQLNVQVPKELLSDIAAKSYAVSHGNPAEIAGKL